MNLALVIKRILKDFEISITSIQGDLIQLELGTVPENFSVAEFSTMLHSSTSELGVAYFSIG